MSAKSRETSLSMMPTEVKQLIVDCAHESDLNYKSRQPAVAPRGLELRKKKNPKRTSTQLRGKAVECLSRVKHEWRSLAIKHVYRVSHRLQRSNRGN